MLEQRLQTHERLPNREQVWALTELSDVEGLRDDVGAAIKKIEVDLEWGDGDDAWASRARGALAAHHTCMSHLNRRVDFLRHGDRGAARAEQDQVGLERQRLKTEQAHANAEAAREQKETKLAVEREKTKRIAMDAAAKQSWLARFFKVSMDNLGQEQFDALCKRADALMGKGLGV